MSGSHTLGKTGEELAAGHLEEKGYRILHRNWKSGRREMDIVSENDEFVVFVEVKTRSADFILHPRDSVTKEKQRLIIYAADFYLRRYNISKESRFDIITLVAKGDEFDIEHIENAFYPTLR